MDVPWEFGSEDSSPQSLWAPLPPPLGASTSSILENDIEPSLSPTRFMVPPSRAAPTSSRYHTDK